MKFSEKKIVPVKTGDDRFPATDLFAISRHEIIPFVQVLRRGIAGDLSVGGNALVVEQHIPAFILVEQKVELATRIEDLVGDEVLRFVIELAFRDDIAPFNIDGSIKIKDHNVLRMIRGSVVTIVAIPWVIIRAIVVRRIEPAGSVHGIIHIIPAIEHITPGGGVEGFTHQQVTAVLLGDDVFDKVVVEGHFQVGVRTFCHGPELFVENGQGLFRPAVGGLVPNYGIESFDISFFLFVVETGQDITFVIIIHFDLDLIQDPVGRSDVFYRKAIRQRPFGDDSDPGNEVVTAAAQEFAEDQLSIVVKQEIGKKLVSFFHGKEDAVPVDQSQLGIVQEAGEQEVLGVLAIDLKDHDPLLVIADHGGVDLVIGGKSYLGRVQFDGLPQFLSHPIHFDRVAINDAPALVFIDHIEIILVGHEIDVNVFVRHKGQGDTLHEFHIPVVDADGAAGVIVLIYEEVAVDLTNDLKIGTAAIFPFRLRVGDLLGFQQAGSNQERYQ